MLGSTTMVIHVEGTTIPGAALTPEFLKAHVYLPPLFVHENPASHAALAAMVQLFIEHVGIPTAASWTRRARARNWPLTQAGSTPAAPPAYIPLIPDPAPRSSYYLFRGRPPTGIAPSILLAAADPPAPSSSQLSVYDIDEIELNAAEESLLTALERNAQLENDVVVFVARIAEFEERQGLYDEREEASQERIRELESEISRLQHEVRQAQCASLTLFHPIPSSLHSPP